MKTRMLVLLIAGALTPMASQAQNVYKNANFAVAVAPGWQAQPQEGTPMVSFVNEKAKASVSVGVMTGNADNTPSAEKELQNIESQFPDNCPQAKIKQRGPITLGGWSGAFLLVNCMDKDAGLEVMKYAAATKPGVMVMLISASPANNYQAVLPAMDSIEHSLRILNGGGQQGGSNSQAPASSNMYRDPQGRYRLSVPDGWNTSVDNGTLQVSSGSSWAVLMTGGGSQAGDVNHQVTQQIQAQYTQFQKLNEGDLQVNGHPAHGTTATGINPKGQRVSVLVLSISAGSGNFLTVVSSSPNDQAKAINATMMQMAQSIRFAGE